MFCFSSTTATLSTTNRYPTLTTLSTTKQLSTIETEIGAVKRRESSTLETSVLLTEKIRSSTRNRIIRCVGSDRCPEKTSAAASRSSVTSSHSVKAFWGRIFSISEPIRKTDKNCSFLFCRQKRLGRCWKSELNFYFFNKYEINVY